FNEHGACALLHRRIKGKHSRCARSEHCNIHFHHLPHNAALTLPYLVTARCIPLFMQPPLGQTLIPFEYNAVNLDGSGLCSPELSRVSPTYVSWNAKPASIHF